MKTVLSVVTCATLLSACASLGNRDEVVTTSNSVSGLEVTAEPVGNVGWNITVSNQTGRRYMLVWDESSYVATDGRAAGRLIRGSTKKLFTDRAQPNEPIPPGATLTSYAVPEAQVAAVGSWIRPTISDPSGRGRIVLAFKDESGHTATWEGAVTYLK